MPYGYSDVADRLEAMTDNGLVVSRDQDGGVQHAGDRLIWTGIAMGVLDCERGAAQEDALLTAYAVGLPPGWDLDAELGLLYGVEGRAKRCGSADTWRAILAAQHPNLPLHFDVARRVVIQDLGGDQVSDTDRGALGAELAAWGAGVVLARDAAYRIHLGYLVFHYMEAPKGKADWCKWTKTAKMPLVEHECGRGGLDTWAAGFVYDRAEYILQRATWESETNPSGWHTPALDYLVALRELGISP